MNQETHQEYKTYTTETGVKISIPTKIDKGTDTEQQLSYQHFINVLSNIVTKYTNTEKDEI